LDLLPLFHLMITLPTATLIKWVLMIILLIASGLISGAEVAFFSLTTSALDKARDQKLKQVDLIVRLLRKPKRLLATILVVNNFINIAIVLLFANLGTSLFAGLESSYLKLFIEIVVITFVILLFGEILPKIYANRNNLFFANIMASTLHRIDTYFLFYLTIPMSKLTLFLEERLGQRSKTFSVDELSEALAMTEQSDTTKEEDKILKGIVSFGNTETKQVMCPRVSVFALSAEMSLKEILPQIIDKGFSRIPVYKEGLDNIVGILYTKDLMPNIEKKEFNWTSLLRDPYIIPENKKLDDLLKEFQHLKTHIAIVVDEYGGTSGVVTLEDLIEEIVGDIVDEFDDEDIEYSRLDEKNYVFEAKVSLKDFYRITEFNDSELIEKNKGEAETLGGFILEIIHKLPTSKQIIEFETMKFTIESVDKKRIKQIKVTLP
jgi:putative hemolysin